VRLRQRHPHPSITRRQLGRCSEVRQRGKERALRGVLRLVVVVQLVEGVAVHLSQVLPIEGLEPGRVRLGLLDEPSVTVEVDETPAGIDEGGIEVTEVDVVETEGAEA